MALCYVTIELESMPPKAADAILVAETTCRPCIAAEGHSIAILPPLTEAENPTKVQAYYRSINR